MKGDIVGHEQITLSLLKRWGYCPFKGGREYFINWNGVWLKKISDYVFEYGNPQHHTIDKNHPFIKQGEVRYMDDLEKVNSKRGLEYKQYHSSWNE